jgi:hypothetical protein
LSGTSPPNTKAVPVFRGSNGRLGAQTPDQSGNRLIESQVCPRKAGCETVSADTAWSPTSNPPIATRNAPAPTASLATRAVFASCTRYSPLIGCIAPTLFPDLREHIDRLGERECGFADACFHPHRMVADQPSFTTINFAPLRSTSFA